MRGSLGIDLRGTRLPAENVASKRLPHPQRLLILLALVGHEARAVVAIGLQGVMRGAPEPEVLSGVRATLGKRLSVSKVEAARLVAAVAVFSDKPQRPSSRDYTSRRTVVCFS